MSARSHLALALALAALCAGCRGSSTLSLTVTADGTIADVERLAVTVGFAGETSAPVEFDLGGRVTLPPARAVAQASIARFSAVVSSVIPSPLAPKSRTLNVRRCAAPRHPDRRSMARRTFSPSERSGIAKDIRAGSQIGQG